MQVEKPRLILYAVLLGSFVFAVGFTGFALFYTLDANPEASTTLPISRNGEGAPESNSQSSEPLRAGGEFIHAVAADAANFNPLLATDETAQIVIDLLFPRLLGQDPTTGLIVPTELAERWEISDDGRVYTFYLRDGVAWSDGAPVTAADFFYTYTALGQPDLQSPFQSRAGLIESIRAPDAQTIVVNLHAPNCTALYSLRRPLLPSHHYAPDLSDLIANPLNHAPEVSAGPFLFESHTPGESIVLSRNPAYWKGPAYLDRYILRIMPDIAEQARRLAAGEIDLIRLPNHDMNLLADEGNGNGGNQTPHVMRHPRPGYSVLAVNLADPNQPLPGRTAEGARQPQPSHPILGELQVRHALALAIDLEELIHDIWAGQAYALGGYLLPTIPWANSAQPEAIGYDPAEAARLLDAVGWLPEADGIRYQDGRPLALRLMTNADNAHRVALAQGIQAQLVQIGVQIRVEPLPFDELTAQLLEQRFDLSLVGWDNLAADPGLQPFWHSRDDEPGRGFNFVSFHDPEVDAWLDQALTGASPEQNCAPDTRGAYYAQVQTRVHSQLPYLALIGEWEGWAAAPRWQNVAPGPWQLHYNVQSWGLVE